MKNAPQAMSYGGIYFENIIPGYFTIGVGGREDQTLDEKNETIGGCDGSLFFYKTTPSKTLSISYRLISNSIADARNKLDKINSYLDDGIKEVIFDDEPDKYWKGTIVKHEFNKIGLDTFGGLEIKLYDPYRYAVTLKEVTATKVDSHYEATINNDGTKPAELEISITPSNEVGFIAITNADGAMEYGLREEADKETSYGVKRQIFSINDFINAGSANNYALRPTYGTGYSMSKGNKRNQAFGKNMDYLTLGRSKPPAGENRSKFGNVAVRNLTLTNPTTHIFVHFYSPFVAEDKRESGILTYSCLDASGNPVITMKLYKSSTSSYYSGFECYAGRTLKYEAHFDAISPCTWKPGSANGYADENAHGEFHKFGEKFEFYYWGSWCTFNCPEFKNTQIKTVQLVMGTFTSSSVNPTRPCRIECFVYDVWDYNGKETKDIKNRFSAGQPLTIKEGKFYKNGIYSPEDEVVGTKIIKAPTGESKLRFDFSSWYSGTADIKVRWREKWR